MKTNRFIVAVAIALVIGGFSLQSFVALVKPPDEITRTFALWAWLNAPYVVAAALLTLWWRPVYALGWSVLPLIADAGTYHSVFIEPGSSTAALAYSVVPLLGLCLLGPIGILGAWIYQKSVAYKQVRSNMAPQPKPQSGSAER